MSYFVTGTDTHVGKTLISCALLHGLGGMGYKVVGMKPIAAGCEEEQQNEDVRLLRQAGNLQVAAGQINPYCFTPPAAPHLAARMVGVEIRFGRIMESFRELQAMADVVVVEGAGGFCIPLNSKQNSADMVKLMNLPVILVVGVRLGCLNHALLTAEAVRARGLPLAGWVANVIDADMLLLQDNIAALQELIPEPFLGAVPMLSVADGVQAASYLNFEVLRPVVGDDGL